MTISFDLISDLHAETWPNFDWTGKPTSPYAIVAGDVAEDRTVVKQTLKHLADVYRGVFYIDGNIEHKHYLEDLKTSYQELEDMVNSIDGVVFLRDNLVIIDGIGILGTNGWWTFDFDENNSSVDQTILWYQNKTQTTGKAIYDIQKMGYHDASYLFNSVRRLQTESDVKAAIVVTHTLPADWLIRHDPTIVDTYKFHCMGNQHLAAALEADTEKKIQTWCMGHYHLPINRYRDGVWYVNNCRGRQDSEYRQMAYNPIKISVEV